MTDEQQDKLVSMAANCQMIAAALERSMYSRRLCLSDRFLVELEESVAAIRKEMEAAGLAEVKPD